MIIQANLSLVSNFKGRATIVGGHVSEKVRSESILLVFIVMLYLGGLNWRNNIVL